MYMYFRRQNTTHNTRYCIALTRTMFVRNRNKAVSGGVREHTGSHSENTDTCSEY